MLFPTGRTGRLDDRPVRISASDYRITRLYSEDTRFRTNIEYIFHLLFESELSTVCHAVAHTLKTGTRFQNVTAKDIVDKVNVHDEVLEASITNVFSVLRSTKGYWNRRYSELRCMMRYLGPPTWFLTLSCAEYGWEDLATYIRKSHPNVDGINAMTPAHLCAFDPVSVCRYFDHRFQAMLRLICNKDHPPLSLVEHHFWRKEYQSRGAPHIHMLLWVTDAPKLDLNPNAEVLAFIERYITCDVPSETANKDLREKVLRFQRHKCGKYCQRRYFSAGKHYTKCRFAFPRPVRATSEINSVMSSVRHTVQKKTPKRTYSLKRSLDSQFINDYNALILLLWNANIDVQFVADNSTAVARYVTGYITKAEKSMAQDIWADVAADKTLSERLWHYAIRMLQSRECGIFEAIDFLTASALIGRSITVLWLNLGPAALRKRVLKAFPDLQHLASIDPDSFNILKDNLIDTYYPKRSLLMDDMCLFEVAEHFSFRIVQEDHSKGAFALIGGRGCLVRHKKPCLIQHKQLSCDTEEQKEMYFFCILQLFKPWRAEEELRCGQLTYEEAFLSVCQDIASPKMEMFINTLQKQVQQEKFVDEQIHKHTPEPAASLRTLHDDPLGCPLVQADVHLAMEEVQDAMRQAGDVHVDLPNLLTSLNNGQTEIYNDIVQEIHLSLLHNHGDCPCPTTHQLLRFISGEAGTGKSFLIRALCAYMKELTGSSLSCIVAAPTGLAAFNVGGITLHRLLMLPVEHDNKLEYSKLSSDTAKEIARVLRKVHLLIIDEVSMVSNLMLAFIHLRMQEVLRSPPHTLFGAKHVVVFGDLLQLTPVKGQPVFKTLTSKDAMKGIGCIGNVNLWLNFQYHELTQNMRQADDLAYGQMLQGIRIGQLSDHVKETLHTRVITSLFPEGCTGPQLIEKLHNQNIQCVTLMSTNADCEQFNQVMMLNENQPIMHLKCIDTVEGEMLPLELNKKVTARLQQLETAVSHTAGLDSDLKLCVHCRVMLRRNMDVEKGLVNGAMGHILSFLMDDKTGLVLFVIVQFDHVQEPALIGRITARFKLFRDVFIKRMQFPLCSAYAITIHKSQGLSLDAALIDIGPKVFKEAMVYVALSRVKQLSGLFLLRFDDSKVKADVSCVLEYNRL